MFKSLVATLFAVLWLTGCGTVRLVDTDVRSFVTPPLIVTGATYRFERLPSQQVDLDRQNRLEAMAQEALTRVGLKRQDLAPAYSVQVSVGTKVDAYGPGDRPSSGWMPGWNFGVGVSSGNVMIGANRGLLGFAVPEQPYYWRQVSLVIRNLSTSQVVYETRAAHDGRWADSDAILPAMLEAALKDFPNPPAGLRRVNIEIPR
jgi:hypothetical protein